MDKSLNFKYVELQNFLSYRHVKMDLTERGLIYVSGQNKDDNNKSNGAGKSTLFCDSITWCLFGKLIRDIPVGKIPNRFAKGQCVVEVMFYINDNKYIVRRSRRPEEPLYYEINGEDKSRGDSRETTKDIVNLLGMGHVEFLNSILFGQNIQKYFFLLTDAKQKDMLDGMIAIGDTIEAYKKSAVQQRDKAIELQSMKETQIHETENLMELCRQRIHDYDVKGEDFIKKEKERIDASLKNINNHLSSVNSTITDLEKQVKDLGDLSNYETLRNKKEEIRTAIVKLQGLKDNSEQVVIRESELEIVNNVLVLRNPSETRSIIELEQESSIIKDEILSLNSQLHSKYESVKANLKKVESVTSIHNVDCPTCGRLVDDTCVDAVRDSYNNLVEIVKKEAELIKESLNTFNEKQRLILLAMEDRANTDTFEQVKQAKVDVGKYTSMISIMEDQSNNLIKEIQELQTKVTKKNELNVQISRLQSDKEMGTNRKQELKTEREKADKDPYEELKSKEVKNLNIYTEQIERIQKEQDIFMQYIEACRYWEKAFGDKDGIKAYIYDKVFPFLNARCNHYLSILSGNQITATIGLDVKGRFIVSTENKVGADVYGGNCLTADSLISMADGRVKYINTLIPGDLIWAVYPKKGLVKDYVDEIVDAGIKDVYRVDLEGKSIEASDNHPFLVVKESLTWDTNSKKLRWLEWVQLKDIKKGDVIAVMSDIPGRKICKGIDFDNYIGNKSKYDFMRLLGFYVGDGWIRVRRGEGYEFALAVYNDELMDKYRRILTDLFGVTEFGNKQNEIHIYQKYFVKMIQQLGLQGKSWDKDIPDWIMMLPNELKMQFLLGYLDSDGSEDVSTWKFEAANETLIKKLRMMIIHMGYTVSKVSSRFRDVKVICGKVVKKIKRTWLFSCYPDSSKGVLTINDDQLPNYLYYKKIADIKYKGKYRTWDIKIRNSRNFFANGILVHNSGGEKRRIDMSIMLALHDLVASRKHRSNILILDEIFDNLDVSGIDSAMALLDDLSNQYDSIFVISHTDFKEYFDNHINIIKDGNISYVRS